MSFLFYKKKKYHKTQPHDARIHASDSFSSGQLITRRLHRHGRVELRSRFLIELHSDAMSPPFLPCPLATPPPPHPSILKPQPVRAPESIQQHAYLRKRAREASSVSSEEAVCRSSKLLERAAAVGSIP